MEETIENLQRRNEELKKIVLSQNKRIENLEVCIDSLLNAVDSAALAIQSSTSLVEHLMGKKYE